MVACVVGRDRLVGEGDGRDLLAADDDAPDGLDELDRELEGAPNLLTAGDFDLSLLEVGVPARLFWLLVTLSVAELVMVICCWGRLSPSLGEQGAEAD
jgi:hypothetical protein